jgi:hypothetical protein
MATEDAVNTNIAKKPPQPVTIDSNGRPSPDPVKLDGNDNKHPARVQWHANPPAVWEIKLQNPPQPFKNPKLPILTDAKTGYTDVLIVDKQFDKPGEQQPFVYTIVSKGKVITSGNGIIVDA